MNFNKWILETKPRILAKHLQIDPSAVSAWQTKRTCPRPKHMTKILKLSRGKITYADIINYYLSERAKN